MKTFIILIYLFSSTILYAQAEWIYQNPTPTASNLRKVDFLNENTGFAVGSNHEFLKTTNGGINWAVKKLNIDNFQAHEIIYNLSFPSENVGYVTNYNGKLFKTIDGGENFFHVNAPILNWGFPSNFKFINNDIGFNFNSQLYRTTNGGTSWDTIKVNNFKIKNFNVYNNKIYAIGFDSAFQWTWGVSEDYGNTFTVKDIHIQAPYTDIIKLDVVNDFLFAVGNKDGNKKYLLIGNILSNTWSESFIDSNYHFNDICFLNHNTGFILFGNNNSKIKSTTNRGKTWQSYFFDNNINISFRSISKLNDITAVVVGDIGLILKTTNAGIFWNELSRRVTTQDLNYLSFANGQIGIVTGNKGTVLRTSNGGSNWINLNLNTHINFNNVSFFNDGIGFITGDTSGYYKTTDYGQSWNYYDMSIYGSKFYSSFSSSNSGGLIGGYPTKLVSTIDGGQTWSHKFIPMSTPNGYPPSGGGGSSGLHGVKCIGSNNFLGLNRFNGSQGSSQTTIFLSTNRGANWVGVASTTQSSNGNWGVASYFGLPSGFCFANLSHIQGNIFKTIITHDLFQNTKIIYDEPVSTAHFINNQNGIGVRKGISISNNSGASWTSIGNNHIYPNDIKLIDENNAIYVTKKGVIVKIANIDWTVGISNISQTIPDNFILHQNYPNPFNPVTKITFEIPLNSGNELISLQVFNSLGQLIDELVNTELTPGTYEYSFDGENLSSGIYYYRLKSDNFIQSKKMILLK